MTAILNPSERRRRIMDIVEAYKAAHSPGDFIPLMTALADAGFDNVVVTAGVNADGKMDLLIQDAGAVK